MSKGPTLKMKKRLNFVVITAIVLVFAVVFSNLVRITVFQYDEYKQKAIEKMINIGGENLQNIVIGDLMFFENPDDFREEFSIVGYGPEVDSPSSVEELMNCFSNYDFTLEVHKLHPLVGVIIANRK